MAENLRINIQSTGAEKAAADFNKVGSAMQKTAKRSGAANQAIINLGRGVSDARFGFHGLANNLEFVVEMLGQTAQNAKITGQSIGKQLVGSLLGPAGLVAGISILIAYGPEIYQFFKDMASGQSATARETQELNDRLREQYGLLEQAGAIDPKDLEEALEKIKEINDKLPDLYGRLELGKNNPLVGSLIEDKIKSLEKTRADLLKTLSEIELKQYDEDLEKKKNKDEKAYREIVRKRREIDEELEGILGTPFSLSGADNQYRKLLAARKALGLKGDFSVQNNVETADYDTGADDDLDAVLASVGSPLAGLNDEEVAKYLENVNLLKQETESFRDAVGDAFSDLGDIIATNLGRGNNAFSAFVGGFIQTYTKLLTSNKAFLAKLIPIKTAEAGASAVSSAAQDASKIPFGSFALPALIAGALAAVSAGFSKAGVSGGVGGGGGRSTSATIPTNPIANPTIQGRGGEQRLVSKINGQDLLFVLENAQAVQGQTS